MPILLGERAVDLIKDYLAANLATHVADINDETAFMPVELKVPQTFATSERRVLPNPLPAILVIAEDTSLEGVIDSPGFGMNTYTSVTIYVVDVHPDQDVLRTLMYRHVAAIVRCLRAGEADAEFAYVYRDPLASYGPVYVDQESQILFGDAQVRIRVLLEESEP